MSKNSVSRSVLPVLFGFFVMGFCDVVGIATSYVKADFHLTETIAGFLPSMVFLWFLLLSVPTAILMNKIGRKQTVMLSMLVTVVGMFVPFASYNMVTCMIGFALLGIGNTILQVSLNPLLTNVVKGDALTSSLTTGQVVKAVSSFTGPFIAAFALNSLGNWHYLFPIFAAITVLSALWLMFTSVPKEQETVSSSSLSATFSLLKDKTILLLFLGIVFVVGTDVGMNTVAPKLLIERLNMPLAQAGFGSSVYFAFRTAGALLGAILLAKINEMKYFRVNMFIAITAMIVLFFIKEQYAMLTLVGVVGFTCSSIFAVIYSMAIQARPEKANEISGLLITGVFGGAVIPPLMGLATDAIGSQVGSLIVILLSICYLLYCSFGVKVSKV
jgi:FHS family L-fucose permease-like MFS transporter